MVRQILGPRKRRTRQHVIADLGVHHLERFILEEGHTCQRLSSDYGYDLILWTFDEQGYPEPGSVYFQCKSAEKLDGNEAVYVFDLEVRDYNLWMFEKTPVILVLFDASRRRAYWLYVQQYFHEDPNRQPQQHASTARVRVPKHNAVSRRAVRKIRNFKHQAQSPMKGTQ